MILTIVLIYLIIGTIVARRGCTIVSRGIEEGLVEEGTGATAIMFIITLVIAWPVILLQMNLGHREPDEDNQT